MLTKTARNLIRLLSRVGPTLAGATARDLKFLRRRGFAGFGTPQVQYLRSRGLLPTIQQELAGFNKGTENMLRGAKVVRGGTKDFRVSHNSDGSGATAYIPAPAAPNASLSEQEARAAIGRHEAREYVRMNAGRRHGWLTPDEYIKRDHIGTSHMPGVMYDERVFRSGLSNRLGLGEPWFSLPLSVDVSGRYPVRGPRDTLIGSQPLQYEFNLGKRWARAREAEMQAARQRIASMMGTPEAESLLGRYLNEAGNTMGGWGVQGAPNQSLVRRFMRDSALGYENSQAAQKVYELPEEARRAVFQASDAYTGHLYDMIPGTGSRFAAVVRGTALPHDSEVSLVNSMSSWPNYVTPAQASPGPNWLQRAWGRLFGRRS